VIRWQRAIVLGGIAAVAVTLSRDAFDRFRFPKALIYQGEAIVIVAVALAALILGAPLPRLTKWRLPLAAFGVMAVLTLTSTKPALSASALAAGAATLIVFLATVAAARDRRWILLGVPLAVAAGNALLVLIEEANLWMPFGTTDEISHHLQCTALVGNPNEVGGYLGAAALACLALLAERRWLRWSVAAMLVIGAGLVASRTLTAMVAFAAAALAMSAIASWKNALRALAVVVVAALLVVALVAPLRRRAMDTTHWLKSGEYNSVLTERLTPFIAAWTMFTDHPLTGVGPGAFAWHYYDSKIRAEQRLPSLRLAYHRGSNAGEAHNDHLQVLAEGGVLGYAAFAAVLGALASLSFKATAPFARRLALPLAVYWAVLSLAQFPLETTVVRSLLVHFAALCAAWSEP
jgi:hypothetical protein